MSTPLPADAESDPIKGAPSFPFRHRVQRALWTLTWAILASWTPAPFHRWRIVLLRLAGAKVHPTAHVYGSARVWYPPNLTMEAHACIGPNVNFYNMAPIRLGAGAILSQGAQICAGTHDIDDPHFQLIVRPIEIGANAWIAADAFVGPGVSVGEGAVLGARGVLFKDAEPWTVFAGNPAQKIRTRNIHHSGKSP